MEKKKFEDYKELELRTLHGRKVILKVLGLEAKTLFGGAWVEGVGDTDAAGYATVLMPDGRTLMESGQFEGCDIDPEETYFFIEATHPMRGRIVFDKASSDALRDFNHARNQAALAVREAKYAAEEAAVEAVIPGYLQLRDARRLWSKYRADFADAMESEDMDGVNMPTMPKVDMDELRLKYPRAAVYMRAIDCENGSHFMLAKAGKKAKELLLSGGSLEEATAILDNWTNEINMWN